MLLAFEVAQLEWIRTLALHRTALLDNFFIFWNFFDKTSFYLLLIPCVHFFSQKKSSRDLIFLLIISAFLNVFLKKIFQIPRPTTLDPSLLLVPVGSSSFPSGAAQSSAIILAMALRCFKDRRILLLTFFFSTTLSFSRLYLAVHFPLDILIGWCTGFAIYKTYYLFLETPLSRHQDTALTYLTYLSPLLLLISVTYAKLIAFAPLICTLILIEVILFRLTKHRLNNPNYTPIITLGMLIVSGSVLITIPLSSCNDPYLIGLVILCLSFVKRWKQIYTQAPSS